MILLSASGTWPAIPRRSDLHRAGFRGPRRRAHRPGRAQRRRQDHLDPDPGRARSARLRPALRSARDPGQPAAAGDQFQARRDIDRGRQVGACVPARPAARARGSRPGDGRGRRLGRPRARRAALRRAAQPDRAPGCLLDRSPDRGSADGPRVSASPNSTARRRRSPAASSRG